MTEWITSQWLNAEGGEQKKLRALAEEKRQEIFGQTIFVRAVVEVSNYCRENCAYCGMRRDNRDLQRYRLDLDILRQVIFESMPSTVTDLNIQTGEDPVAVREIVLPLIREVREKTSLGVSVCLGTFSQEIYEALREAGASYYIIKLETGNADHYRTMQSPGDFQERLDAIRRLAEGGWHVSSGLIYGLPDQTEAHVLESIKLLCELPLSGCSVSPFIPGEGTPFAKQKIAKIGPTLNAVAMMRLSCPHWVIPAVSAMNLVNDEGYSGALQAGANLTTINLTPEEQRKEYQLYKKERFIMKEERVLKAIEKVGGVPSETSLCQFFEEKNRINSLV